MVELVSCVCTQLSFSLTRECSGIPSQKFQRPQEKETQVFSELFPLHCAKYSNISNRNRTWTFRHKKLQFYHLSKRTQIRVLLNKAHWKHHLNTVTRIHIRMSNELGAFYTICLLSTESGCYIFKEHPCVRGIRIFAVWNVIQIIKCLKHRQSRKNTNGKLSPLLSSHPCIH